MAVIIIIIIAITFLKKYMQGRDYVTNACVGFQTNVYIVAR